MIAIDDLPRAIEHITDLYTHRSTLLERPTLKPVPKAGTLPLPVTVPYNGYRKYKKKKKKANLLMLVQDYWYRGICIPAGFVFDGASIPRFFHRLWTPFHPSHQIAALIHDWLYFTRLFARITCDKIFAEVLDLTGNGWFKRKSMYRAVRFGGSSAYHND